MGRSHRLWIAGGALLLLLLVGPGLARRAADFDIVGMLAQVRETNGRISKTNDEILKSLEAVKEQAGAVTGVHGRLQKLEFGLTQQADVLGRLDKLTGEQAEMSRRLRDLTASVDPSTARLAATAREQAAALNSMSRSTAELASRIQQIGALNRSTAEKLQRAEYLSATVLTRMP